MDGRGAAPRRAQFDAAGRGGSAPGNRALGRRAQPAAGTSAGRPSMPSALSSPMRRTSLRSPLTALRPAAAIARACEGRIRSSRCAPAASARPSSAPFTWRKAADTGAQRAPTRPPATSDRWTWPRLPPPPLPIRMSWRRRGTSIWGSTQCPMFGFLGDAGALRILVRNLVDNAVRYTPERGTVQVHCRGTPEGMVLEVTDTGPGIAAKDRDRGVRPLLSAGARAGRAAPGWGWPSSRQSP